MERKKLKGRQLGIAKYKTTRAYTSLHEPGLNSTEQVIYDLLRVNGWRVLKTGWPDFLAQKEGITRFIEVKSHGYGLNAAQKRMQKSLQLLGIKMEVVRMKSDGSCPSRFSVDAVGATSKLDAYKSALFEIAASTGERHTLDIARKALGGGPPNRHYG